MSLQSPLPGEMPRTISQAKQRAKIMRKDLFSRGIKISYSQALERVAAEIGYRDWNTAVARLSNEPPFRIQVGDTVSGTYLKQPFTGQVLAVRESGGGSHFLGGPAGKAASFRSVRRRRRRGKCLFRQRAPTAATPHPLVARAEAPSAGSRLGANLRPELRLERMLLCSGASRPRAPAWLRAGP